MNRTDILTQRGTAAQDGLHAQVDERACVGCVLAADVSQRRVFLATIDANAFTDSFSVRAIAAIRSVEASGAEVDLVTVTKAMSGQGFDGGTAATLSSLFDEVPSPSNFAFYHANVIEARRRRRLAIAANDLLAAARECPEDIAKALQAVDDAKRDGPRTQGQSSQDVTRALLADIEDRHAKRGALTGVSYGIQDLDRRTDGIQAGEFVVIGARASMGKTAMAVTLTHNIAVTQGIPCVFITLETNPVGIQRRLMANVSGVELGLLKSGDIAEVHRKLTTTAGRIAKAPIRYHYGLGTMDGRLAANIIRNEAEQFGAKIVFLDYIQRLKVDGGIEKRTYGIAENSAELKRACDETGVAIVALAQLNRDAENDDRNPKLSDLAECGQIERDADTVILLHRKREETIGNAMAIIAKARDGECGVVALHYHGPTVRFTDRSRVEDAK
jgi:replicative DNA helicase